MPTRTFEDDLGERIRALADLRALVRDRVYPNQRTPGSVLPCVTYFRLNRAPEQTTNGPTGLVIARYLLECWGDTSDEANRVMLALTQEWPDGIDNVSGDRWGDWFVQSTTVLDARDEIEAPAHAQDLGTPKVAQELLIFYQPG